MVSGRRPSDLDYDSLSIVVRAGGLDHRVHHPGDR